MENVTYFENEILVLDVKKLIFKREKKEISLSKNQTRLIDFLIKGVTQKEELINLLWKSSPRKSIENSYNQLVFKTRAVLIDNGLPEDFLITIPRYGLCINKNYISRNISKGNIITEVYNDHSCLIEV
ncbi:winged helix-turn-helix domain-containing protein [Rahnella sp. EDr1-12]|jgi:DNA-binding winged helix-turn-helix (wHTH) protein|uniref:winged helix-turn-helix domain-containing protein n=1 Tax=unclassified Rahnella TaxID=2635087 RepID=UPI003BACBFB0